MVSTVARSPGAQSAAVTRRAVTRPITVISFGFLHQSSAEKARIESRSTCSLRQTVSTGLTRPLESGVSIPLLRSNDPHLIYMIAVAQLQCEVAVANRSDAEIIAGLFGDLQSRFLCLQSSRDYERSHGGGVLPVNAPRFPLPESQDCLPPRYTGWWRYDIFPWSRRHSGRHPGQAVPDRRHRRSAEKPRGLSAVARAG